MFVLFLSISVAALPHDAVPTKLDEKKICRSDTSTGSHFAKKTCHTKAEWKDIDDENARMARGVNNGGRNGLQSEPFSRGNF